MGPTRRVIFRVDSKSLSVIRNAEASVDLWCDGCHAVVPMIIPESATQLYRITPREIYRRIERNDLHFVETEAGALFICCSSLKEKVSEGPSKLPT